MEARSNNLGVFPSEIDQIPISVEKGYPGHDACDAASNNCVEAEGDKYVEGGELIEPEGTNTGGGPGTACCMVTDSNDNERLLTVAHLFGDCGENINGEGVESYNRNLYGDYLGDVEAYSHKNDWAVIDNSGQGIYNDYIDDNDDYPDVAGVLTEYSISYYASLDDSEQPCFYNMGMTTDKTTGKIQKCHVTNDEDCKTFSGHGVKTSCTFARGDSGGPTYAIDSNGDARIVSVTSEFNCPIYSCVIITCRGTDREGAGKSTGMGAYYIENNTGYTIG
jgi:hypothetical protein